MKKSTFAFIALFALVSCSSHLQETDLISMHIVDRNGSQETISTPERLGKYAGSYKESYGHETVLRTYKPGPDGHVRALLTRYHTNGQLAKSLEIVDNAACGAFCEYYPNGQLKVEATVTGGAPDFGHAAESGWLFDGPSSAYSENGQLLASIPYVKGQISGIALYYDANGQVAETIAYEAGLRHGQRKSALLEERYEKGRLIEGAYPSVSKAGVEKGFGYQASFTEGRLSILSEIRMGRVEGQIECFDEFGYLQNAYQVVGGMKCGSEFVYFPPKSSGAKLQPSLELTWQDDVLNGVSRTWYANGQIESQRELSKNKKNGLMTAWYEDGKILFIEEYDNDNLVKGCYFDALSSSPISLVEQGSGLATLYDGKGQNMQKVRYQNGRPVT